MCGVVGIIGPVQSETQNAPPCWAAHDVYRGLLALQHRGQDAAGILSYDSQTRMFILEKDLGLVSQVFDNKQKIDKLVGTMAIGHTRYATAGTDGKRDIQPMITGSPFGLGMVHNGNILNYHSLTKELAEKYHRQMLTANDLEILMHYLGHFLLEGTNGIPDQKTFSFDNIKKSVARIFDTLIGGYAALALVVGQGLIAFRDPKGIRPLAIGTKESATGTVYCIASETSAMNYLGYKYLRDVEPGEVIFIDTEGRMQSALAKQEKEKAPCMFEWVYFSGADSSIDHQSVYGVRLKLGQRLGMKAKEAIARGEIRPDVVMPVPDTSRPAAIAAADFLGLPYREGLIKNRYVARSFILSSQEKREAAIELKLSPVLSEIEGKSILLVDDSIVRGTTSKKLVAMLKKYGAKEVIFGTTCPPIRFPCYYGIDFPNPAALLANNKSVEDVAQWLDAKQVIYLDEDDLRAATGISKLCMACLNNKYPTDVAEGVKFSSERTKVRAVK